MKISVFGILLLVLVILTVEVTSAPPQTPVSGFCDPKCGVRCGLKGRESRCMKYCMMCCAKCKCVPSGTSGHKDECPCYRDWTSPNGRPKCP